MGVYFGMQIFSTAACGSVWFTLRLNGIFNLKDGFVDRKGKSDVSSSDGEKVYKRKKTADREIFSLGLPLLLFPIFEDFIKSRIKCGFHTFLKKGEDFCL